MRNRRGRRLAGLWVGLALLLAGCGSDDGAGVRNVDGTQSPSGSGTASGSGTGLGSGTASGQAAAACKPVGDAATSDATIAVELKEWAVLPARADVPAGTVTFEARNTGEDAHELVVVRATDPASLPLAADGTVDEEKLPEGAFVGEIEAFPAKQTCPGTFELAAGSYALFCNILETEADGAKENHYANGMRARFEARG
jgi:plastocyanin